VFEPVCISIDLKPVSVNAMYRNYRGRVLLSTEGREFKKEMSNRLGSINNIRLIDAPVRVSVCFTFKDKRRRDIDNYLKSTLDCFTGILYTDDSQITELHVYKVIGAKKNNIHIECSVVH
jgi:Holliday junction resolvase RusA-like endonuclease